MKNFFLCLANIEEENRHFNIERCIIYQHKKKGRLTSTAGGREKIIKAAEVRKDDVLDRMNYSSLDKDFQHQVDNDYYKRYTMTKSLKNVKRKNVNENIQTNTDKKKEETMEPERKRAR